MDEKLKVFEDKMQKSYNNLLEEYTTIRAEEQIRMFWIRSLLIITVHQHHYSRLQISVFRSTYDSDSAMGDVFVKRYRKSYPGF